MFRLKLTTSTAISSLLIVPAFAQVNPSPASEKEVQEIVVIGQRAATKLARELERDAFNNISVITADDVGSLPDRNVAESVRRVSGISIQNDQGEGRYVSIRGLGKNLNSTSVNGVNMPSPEVDSRGVALDVVDSDIIQEITVTKSLTSDMDADGIGGNINIKTVSAFDRKGLFIKAKAEGIYSDSTEEWGEKFSVNGSNVFSDGRLGIAGSISYDKRDFSTDNMELDGGYLTFGDTPYPEEFELRDYEISRQRLSASLNIDFRPDANKEFYVRTLFNEFEDDEVRRRVELKLDDVANITSPSAGILRFDTDGVDEDGDDLEIDTDRDIKLRLETQKITSLQTGGVIRFSDYELDFSLATSHAEEAEPGRIDADFRKETASGDASLNMSNPLYPSFAGLDANFGTGFRTASEFLLGGIELLDGITEEDEDAFEFNLKKKTDYGFLKAGMKMRNRDKSYEITTLVYDGDEAADLSQFSTVVDYDIHNYGPGVNPATFKSYIRENVAAGTFDLEEFDTAEKSNIGDYSSEEEILAAYIMGQYEFNNGLTVTAGVRMEETEFEGTGKAVFLEEGDLSATSSGETVVFVNDDNDERVSFTEVTASSSYDDILPSLMAKYEKDDSIFRFAYYQSIGRPSIAQSTPAAESEVEYDSGVLDTREATVGNPDLKHQLATNLDVSFDTVLGNNSYVSAGLFYKDIDDFIANQTFENVTYQGLEYDELTMPVNLDSADVQGFEIAYLKTFEEYDGLLGGIILGVNATFADSSSKVSTGSDGETREIPTPEFSEDIYNIILGFDKYGYDIRLAYSFQSEYLDEINTGGNGVDRYSDEHEQLDLTISYDVSDQLELTGQFRNITDEKANYYLLGEDGTEVLSQYDEIGYTARMGLRYKF
ncbi:hypothetical protein IMCC14465_18530 [alpha proteobacterium IMCC14465]|uniref:TonB-dependent receptor n=1 Tax=alpha proteobacterium IMCC14465 TaxID=1220535 RepID=J9DXI4_9PROT|nr:hypothetical protein IMCC14465_18530 [alpha proteobacterium IMCC14465]